jgi:hypothetical protein
VRIALLIMALLLLALAPAEARAVTLGTDLTRVPDDRMSDCTRHPVYGVPTYAENCTWYSVISAAENHIVPEGTGVVSRARLRVGHTTGLMQFVIGRAQLDRNKPPGQGLMCCVWRTAGPTFTPAPDTITEIPLNEAVLNVRDFQSNQDLFDTMALSILQPGVPIPAAPALSALGSTSPAGACWPAVQLGNAYCMPGGPGNFAVLFNFDWDLDLSRAVKLASQTALMNNGAAKLTLLCTLTQTCNGVLRLQNAKAPGAAAAAALATYGTTRFAIAAGKQASVKVKLNQAGRRLLRAKRRVRVWANSTVTSGTARRTVSAALTLKR